MSHYYEMLGLPFDAPQRQIKAKYRLLMLKTHPDLTGDQADLEQFNRYNEAYQVLSNPDRRREYNAMWGITVETRPPKRGHDLYQRISISPQDAESGAIIPLTFLRYDPCTLCWCEGCQRCQGVGQIATRAKVRVSIPAGLKAKTTLYVAGEGGQAEPYGPRGDLFVYVFIESQTEKNNT